MVLLRQLSGKFSEGLLCTWFNFMKQKQSWKSNYSTERLFILVWSSIALPSVFYVHYWLCDLTGGFIFSALSILLFPSMCVRIIWLTFFWWTFCDSLYGVINIYHVTSFYRCLFIMSSSPEEGVWKSRKPESGIRNRNGNGFRNRNMNSNVKGNRYKNRDIIYFKLF